MASPPAPTRRPRLAEKTAQRGGERRRRLQAARWPAPSITTKRLRGMAALMARISSGGHDLVARAHQHQRGAPDRRQLGGTVGTIAQRRDARQQGLGAGLGGQRARLRQRRRRGIAAPASAAGCGRGRSRARGLDQRDGVGAPASRFGAVGGGARVGQHQRRQPTRRGARRTPAPRIRPSTARPPRRREAGPVQQRRDVVREIGDGEGTGGGRFTKAVRVDRRSRACPRARAAPRLRPSSDDRKGMDATGPGAAPRRRSWAPPRRHKRARGSPIALSCAVIR